MNIQYVQYGCGLSAPAAWRNFDASPTLRIQRMPVIGRFFSGGEYPQFPNNVEYGDILKGLPLAANSCKAIYSSHTLEHLAFDEFKIALINTHSYLDVGAPFRFVIPDIEQLAREYLSSTDSNASVVFIEQSHLGRKTRARTLKGFLRELLGSNPHLWMWDFKSVKCELEQVGFKGIRRAEIGDSKEKSFSDVEEKGRWTKCLGVECFK